MPPIHGPNYSPPPPIPQVSKSQVGVPSPRKTADAPPLRVPQARVLYALIDEEGERRIMLKDELLLALGYNKSSGTVNRALYGIAPGSKSGQPHPGILDLGLVEELALDIDGAPSSGAAGNRAILHYRITPAGREALADWLRDHELPELRDKSLCMNQRYQKAEATPILQRKDGI